VVNAAGTDADTGRTNMGDIILRGIQHCRQEPTPLVIAVDEFERYQPALSAVCDAVALSRQWLIQWYLLFQNPFALPPESLQILLQNMSKMYFLQAGPDPADLASEDIATRLYDPKRVLDKQTIYQQFHDGYEFRDSTRHATTKDKHGKTLSHNEAEAEQTISKYRVEARDVVTYENFQSQKQQIKRDLGGLPPGYMFYSDGTTVSPQPQYVPMLKEPASWSLPYSKTETLGEKRLREAIEKLRQGTEYHVPQILTPPPLPPTDPTTALSPQRVDAAMIRRRNRRPQTDAADRLTGGNETKSS
jgi:hypothetical protein